MKTRRIGLGLGLGLLAVGAAGWALAGGSAPEAPHDADGVRVYRHLDELTIRDQGEGTAATVDLNIEGSAGLKVAFLARGTGGVTSVPCNMGDRVSGDNTTAKAYRTVDEHWKPVLYRVDQFRYNGGAMDGQIKKEALFTNLHFHGNRTGGQGVLELRELTIYRGEDAAPPAAPTALTARADEQGVHLAWQRSRDNVGVAGYAVSRAGPDGRFVKVAHVALPEWVDQPPAAGAWRYRVRAVDFQDNLGPWSEAATVEAARAGAAAVLPVLEQDRVAYAEHVRAVHAAGRGKVARGRVLCFGDSLTGATVYRIAVEAALGRYSVTAIGRQGWRTEQCRTVIEGDLEKVNPEFCLILLGTNNKKEAGDLPKAMDDLVAMARSCEQRGVVPVVGTIPPRGFTDPQSVPEVRFNEALVTAARANHIPIAYLFDAFQAGGDRRKLLAGDGIHLVTGGWAVAGPAWQAAMEQVEFVVLDE